MTRDERVALLAKIATDLLCAEMSAVRRPMGELRYYGSIVEALDVATELLNGVEERVKP